MKRIILSTALIVSMVFSVAGPNLSCQEDDKNFQDIIEDDDKDDDKEFANGAVKQTAQTISEFRKTTPFLLNDERKNLLNIIQAYSKYDNEEFVEYTKSSDEKSIIMEKTVPILYFYREAFDKVLYELKNTEVKEGTAVVWMLYNMGFVVKTPSGSFAIDIDHRWAVQLEPYLDFLIATHEHRDHHNVELMDAMHNKGKPVLSNFYKKDKEYYSKTGTSYKIGIFTIKSSLTDHLNNVKDFNMVYRVECGEDAGNFSILHCGDSGFKPERFINVQGPVSMVVLRYGAKNESDILGTGEGQVETDYAALSHILELRHKPWPNGQASIPVTLNNLPNVKCKNTFLPFWGEKMTWENGKMY